MIDKQKMTQVIEEALEGTPMFLVELKISRDNVVDVAIDSLEGVTIDDCVSVNDAVLAAFDRDEEDFELTVGSYSISDPFLVKRQYEKNLGNEVEVLTGAGKKLCGTLTELADDTFTITVPTKVKVEGKKRPQVEDVAHELRYDEIKYTKNIIKI